ncbi:MAG: hypothetical protein ACOYMR_10410 [Ilumatobacteraceae bacterium]
MKKHTRTAVAAVALGAGLLGLVVVGADAKGGGGNASPTADARQNVSQAGTCDGGASLSLGYNKSGKRVTFAVTGAGGAADEVWWIGLNDNGAGLNGYTASTSDWMIIDNEALDKGEHVVSVLAGSTLGQTCTASVSFKI